MEPAVEIVVCADWIAAGNPLVGLVKTGGFGGGLGGVSWNRQMVGAEVVFDNSLLGGAALATATPFKLADGGAASVHFLVKVGHVDGDGFGVANGGNVPRARDAVVGGDGNQSEGTDHTSDADGDERKQRNNENDAGHAGDSVETEIFDGGFGLFFLNFNGSITCGKWFFWLRWRGRFF